MSQLVYLGATELVDQYAPFYFGSPSIHFLGVTLYAGSYAIISKNDAST